MARYLVRMKNGVTLEVRADSKNEAEALALAKMRSMGYDKVANQGDKAIASAKVQKG